MLQQILKEMYIDPDVLEALNEEQKKILFLKMRQEQVRRWTEREENFKKERECLNSAKPKQASPKSVSWLLGNDGDVHVCVIGEAAGAKPYDLIHSQVDDKRETNNHNAR
ncbi:SH2 domain-containing protein 4B [Acipenser ruthenus]|uniref:SH2 domain-containing protein 4B n=1 Tax=Acipenser ruthenus TaxID=7906 RepID=A0A444UI26_ACIRT|nr:SH2 domain-containing protein 4B [Acipenser ruthenus]